MHEIQCLSYSKMRGETRNKAEGKQSGQGSHQNCTCIPDYILYVNAVCLFTNPPKPDPGRSSEEAARIDLPTALTRSCSDLSMKSAG